MGAAAVARMMVPRPLTFAIAGPLAGLMAKRIAARTTVTTLANAWANWALKSPSPTRFF